MKKTLGNKMEWILTGMGVLIIAFLTWFMVWGVSMLAADIGSSLNNPRGVNSVKKFNIEGATKLDFRGLN